MGGDIRPRRARSTLFSRSGHPLFAIHPSWFAFAHFLASSSPRTSRPTGPFSRAPCAATGRREKEKERDPESPPKEWKYFSSPLAPLPLSIPHLTSPARRRQEPQGRRGALPMQAQLNQSPMPLRFSSLLSFLLPLAFRPPHAPHRTRR